MTVDEFVPAVFLKATGKVPTFTSGSSKWEKILGIANFYITRWARERGVDWNSLYEIVEIGTVGASDTFDLDSAIRKVSKRDGDCVRITHVDGGYTDYQITDIEKLKIKAYGHFVAQNGRSLVFNRTFESTDAQFGGTIKVPSYITPDAISSDTDEIPVDDPDWLVLITAAEYIRNDITRQNQYGNLTSEANEAMSAMKDDNGSQDTSVVKGWNPMGYC